MNAKDAIEKLKLKQEAMMLEARKMEMRVGKLKKIEDFQTNFHDRQWVVAALDIDGLVARSMMLKDAESGILIRAWFEIDLEIATDGFDHNTKEEWIAEQIVTVKKYIGEEEE
mgnify:CR=1 FL=1